MYLNAALASSELLSQTIRIGGLLAYADDLLITARSRKELEALIKELESLETNFGIKLNKRKTVYLTTSKEAEPLLEIRGIQGVTKTRYLGLQISNDK